MTLAGCTLVLVAARNMLGGVLALLFSNYYQRIQRLCTDPALRAFSPKFKTTITKHYKMNRSSKGSKDL